ncbi:MAG: hypothetical protein WBG46_05785 [Nonlabens sp.]
METNNNAITQFELKEVNFAILPFNQNWYWIFENAKPIGISKSELIEIESILKIAIEENNRGPEIDRAMNKDEFPKYSGQNADFIISLERMNRQYVPVLNKNGDKEVWINFFCDDTFDHNWKVEPVIVLDGGNCYFSLKVNVSKKTYSDLSNNGYA